MLIEACFNYEFKHIFSYFICIFVKIIFIQVEYFDNVCIYVWAILFILDHVLRSYQNSELMEVLFDIIDLNLLYYFLKFHIISQKCSTYAQKFNMLNHKTYYIIMVV